MQQIQRDLCIFLQKTLQYIAERSNIVLLIKYLMMRYTLTSKLYTLKFYCSTAQVSVYINSKVNINMTDNVNFESIFELLRVSLNGWLTLPKHVVVELEGAVSTGLFQGWALENGIAVVLTIIRLHSHVPAWHNHR